MTMGFRETIKEREEPRFVVFTDVIEEDEDGRNRRVYQGN